MKSNICVIKQGGSGLEMVLSETQKVTDYNGLKDKEALRLRLLAEELVGMLPELVKNFEGRFWVQNDENCYELHAEFSVENLSKEKKEELIAVSANKKNAAVTGFMGKIRDIAENMLLYSENPSWHHMPEYDYMQSYDNYTYAWSLESYVAQERTRHANDGQEWDQLERSIVAKLADDVIVGVRGKKVEITIKKAF